jgi:hypothetical protein
VTVRQLVGSFLRYGHVFAMTSWSAYIDESYNKEVFCIGGWVAPVGMWTRVERSWVERIAYENRKSVKAGFPPISRYHATDCAGLHREFSKKNGWDIRRQIQLSSKLCGILAAHAPVGIVQGGLIEGLGRYWPDDEFRTALYFLSFGLYLIALGEKMQQGFPEDRVTVFYDDSKELGVVAQKTFKKFMEEDATKHLSKYFVTCAPMTWQNCVPLQPADLLAYEGMKRIQQKISGVDAMRKSLQAILGKRTEIGIGWLEDRHFKELRRIAEERRGLQ